MNQEVAPTPPKTGAVYSLTGSSWDPGVTQQELTHIRHQGRWLELAAHLIGGKLKLRGNQECCRCYQGRGTHL